MQALNPYKSSCVVEKVSADGAWDGKEKKEGNHKTRSSRFIHLMSNGEHFDPVAIVAHKEEPVHHPISLQQGGRSGLWQRPVVPSPLRVRSHGRALLSER
jgi:hypothetical protein